MPSSTPTYLAPIFLDSWRVQKNCRTLPRIWPDPLGHQLPEFFLTPSLLGFERFFRRWIRIEILFEPIWRNHFFGPTVCPEIIARLCPGFGLKNSYLFRPNSDSDGSSDHGSGFGFSTNVGSQNIFRPGPRARKNRTGPESDSLTRRSQRSEMRDLTFPDFSGVVPPRSTWIH